jgi:hypothetical protein
MMKKSLQILAKIATKSKKNAGITQLEMLLTGLFTAIVFSAAGNGLASIMKTQTQINHAIDRRIEVNRALDFMSEESRQARTIEIAGNGTDGTVTLASVAPTFAGTISGYDYTVLLLELPDVSERVIYYLETPGENSVWRGPKVVYRWGPTLDAGGNYTNPHNPATWTSEPLIDQIDNTSSILTCPIGWSMSPGNGTIPTGFSACISPGRKGTQISLNGKINQTAGSSATYQGDKIVSAMADIPPGVAEPPDKLNSKQLNSKPVADVPVPIPNCSVTNGILSCDSPATLNFKVIGDAFSCNGWGEVTTAFKINDTYIKENGSNKKFRANDNRYEDSFELPADSTTKVVVESNRQSGCGPLTRRSNESKDLPFIKALHNGDPAPDVPGWGGQDDVASFLRPYTDANGNISIDDNQIIYLFEMWTSTTSSTYDLQDNVVLVTVEPPSEEKNNNGHGNNVDGVDSSNPGNAPFVDSNPNVDDEITKGGGSTKSKNKK